MLTSQGDWHSYNGVQQEKNGKNLIHNPRNKRVRESFLTPFSSNVQHHVNEKSNGEVMERANSRLRENYSYMVAEPQLS